MASNPIKTGAPIMINSKEEFDRYLADCGDMLLVVDFYADWCGPCRQIGPAFVTLAKDNPDVCFIKVNVDEQEEISESCKISAMPTFQFYKNGKQLHEFKGANQDALTKKIAELK